MLTEIYIEALLVNEKFADQVWEAWDKGEIDDQIACIAWMMIAGRSVRRWPGGAVNNQLESLPMPKFLRKIAVTDANDPHVTLEKLHRQWANATEETEAAWHVLMANPLDQTLRNDYFEKQQLSIQAGQDILEHKRETGV
jgi:hypothetical protein